MDIERENIYIYIYIYIYICFRTLLSLRISIRAMWKIYVQPHYVPHFTGCRCCTNRWLLKWSPRRRQDQVLPVCRSNICLLQIIPCPPPFKLPTILNWVHKTCPSNPKTSIPNLQAALSRIGSGRLPEPMLPDSLWTTNWSNMGPMAPISYNLPRNANAAHFVLGAARTH